MAATGRIIDGRYVVEAELGSGGMGVVLRVRHRFTGAMHALKMLRPDFASDVETQNRFLAEARAATAIGHHGIVQVLDAGKTPEGELYIVMELLQGQSLRPAMGRTAMPMAALKRIGLELLDALGAAHARGFVHRDLKPENVFLVAPNGTAKLLDFGIAKIAQAANMTAAPRTAAGVVLGTLAYMAPEQLHDARSVDPRADLWALGVMFFEMITGRLPWPQRTMTELFIALESEEPTKIEAVIPSAPPPVVAFFARALSRDPRARFQSTAEMAAALAALPATTTQPAIAYGQTQASSPGITQATGPGSAGLPMSTPQPYVQPARAQPPTAPPPTVTPYPPQPQLGIAPTVGVAPPHRSKTLLALGLGAVAVGLIVTAVVIATRETKHAVITDTEGSGAALPEKHVVDNSGTKLPVDPPPPPTPTPPDAPAQPPKTVVRRPPPPDAATPAPTPPQPVTNEARIGGMNRTEFCTKACGALDRCGIGASTCMRDCDFSESSYACGSAAKSCNELAGCVWSSSCHGTRPSGGGSCAEALACEAQCGNSIGCICTCAQQMAMPHAQLLLAFDLCLGTCGNNPQCAQQRCMGISTQCLSQ